MQLTFVTSLSFLGFLFSREAHAAPSLSKELAARAPGSCHTASNRACWNSDYNIDTDYEVDVPITGVTRNYELTISEKDNWTGPDGFVKDKVMLINDKIMGPTIYADWGDTIQVKVTNNLKTNGSSIHFHGIRQLGSVLNDGVNGVTECPIPPEGGEKTYTFIAQQYGTTWYHSHFSAQYGNGVVGAMIINGPASLPYDIDLGALPITDYYHRTADELVEVTKDNGPPPSDNVLINGTVGEPSDPLSYPVIKLTPGKRHRLRLINPSVENHFQISLVDHNMTIIAADLVPVKAMTVDSLFLGVGQRYDVTIDADASAGNYWLNVTFGGNGQCGVSANGAPAAVLHYDGAPTGALPTKRGDTPRDHQCLDLLNLSPVVERSLDVSGFNPNTENTLPVEIQINTGTPIFVWRINGRSVNVDWNKPLLEYVMEGNSSYPVDNNVVKVDAKNEWMIWLVENGIDDPFALPHPMHLHGHDSLLLGRSPPDLAPGTHFNRATDLAGLKSGNPTRRDTLMLPAKGWVVFAFRSDNPGAWLMHCHIAWHVSAGLSVDFLEREDELRAGFSDGEKSQFNRECAAWRAKFPNGSPYKSDSGL